VESAGIGHKLCSHFVSLLKIHAFYVFVERYPPLTDTSISSLCYPITIF
jgi:hypothetical protein